MPRVNNRIINAKRERTYVKVNLDCDSTGYMRPKSIIWQDGRIFPIEEIKDFRPADMEGRAGDCFVVVIQGQEKHLFFEHTDPRFGGRFGRWFVEQIN